VAHHGAHGGTRTHTKSGVGDRRSVLLSYAGHACCDWHPWRESNSHPQLRKLALYPLSYRGVTGCAAPLAGLEPATAGSGNRCAIRCATGTLRRRRDSNPQPRVTRRLVSNELHYRSATPPDVRVVARSPTGPAGRQRSRRLGCPLPVIGPAHCHRYQRRCPRSGRTGFRREGPGRERPRN
jgi:hypothetical protein